MIVVDSSAIVAVVLGEPEARQYADAIVNAEACRVSVLSVFETRVVLSKRAGELAVIELSRLFAEGKIETVAFDEHQSALAFDAYYRWGKGSHPAGLNLGDCAAYALAKSLDAPLLFKGSDFAKTDIRRAL